MDQELLNSAKYRITSLSIDSRFADQLNAGTADYIIRLPSTYRNIMRIALASVELPLVEHLFSKTHDNIQFSIQLGGGPIQTFSIPEGNYTDVDLVTTIHDILVAYDPKFEASLDVLSGKFSIRHADTGFAFSGLAFTEKIASRQTHWGLAYYLGFRTKGILNSSLATTGEQFLTGTSILSTQSPAYYLMQLACPDQLENIVHRLSKNSSIPAFAKLILRDNTYVLQFDDGGNMLRKEYTFLAPSNITQLHIRLVDPFGETVNMFDMDWSATFELYEVVNTRTYTTLNQTYGRPNDV